MAEFDLQAFSRRRFLCALAASAAPVVFLQGAKAISGEKGQALVLEPTPPAGEPFVPTPEETAGPFFKPNSPAKNDFREAGLNGTPVRLTGFVLDQKGHPVSGALLDFWHADDKGEYDFKGYRCRGHQFSGAGANMCWKPSCRVCIRAGRVTIMSGCKLLMGRFYRPNSIFQVKRETQLIGYSGQICC